MKKRIRIRMVFALLVFLPMTMAPTGGDGDSIIDWIVSAMKVDCCVGQICEPNACWFLSDCTSDSNCLQ